MNTQINTFCQKGHLAFEKYQQIPLLRRYMFLKNIAFELIKHKHQIIEIATQETHLLSDELTSEFDRTLYQIYQYADASLNKNFVQYHAEQNNLKLNYVPLGLVVIFGASNFPLAYSAAGGDVISALATGCCVIFKGHENHPQTSHLIAQCISQALTTSELPQDIYQILPQDTSHNDLADLIQHDCIQAVSFTGSTEVGRILFDLCQNRSRPISFFGEMGSLNPVFFCQSYFQKHFLALANSFFTSFTTRCGQVCVNPSIILIPNGSHSHIFKQKISDLCVAYPPRKLLSEKITHHFKSSYEKFKKIYPQLGTPDLVSEDQVKPLIFTLTAEEWLNNYTLLTKEVFGPLGFIITYNTDDQLQQITDTFCGQLTASIFGDEQDQENMLLLFKKMQKLTGRIIFNDYPTGVSVDYAMTHGGVYPATTNSQITSVGSRCLNRFIRPITYQSQPDFFSITQNLHQFQYADNLFNQAQILAQHVAETLAHALIKTGSARLAVSGGKSPIEFFLALSHIKIDWSSVIISLVDERVVSPNSEHSNEALIRKHLLINYAKNAQFIPLLNQEHTTEQTLKFLNQDHHILHQPFDCIILGMGEDGHFASLFPHSENLSQGLDSKEKYSFQNAPIFPQQRISMNLKHILTAPKIYLSIAGKAKINILCHALERKNLMYPLSFLLTNKKIHLFFSE